MAVTGSSADAALKMSHVFGDNMVLQRDRPVPVWGTAEPQEKIAVAFGGQSKDAVADDAGRWRVVLDPMPGSAAPRDLTVSNGSGGERRVLSNVLVGEVWLCSGQSNMQWPLSLIPDGAAVIAAAKDPLIRFLQVPLKQSRVPLEDIEPASWKPCVTNEAKDSSAVAYFFARRLRQELDVPVGMMAAAWGGSWIQPWTPPEGYAAVPALGPLKPLTAEELKAPPTWEEPSNMYNAQIKPLVPMALRGFLWYQGESNVPDGLLYAERMQALVKGWRAVWKDEDLPFYFVQICPHTYADQDLQFIWMAQSMALAAIPRSGIAVTTDVGDLADIHPPRKREVGERLALLALNQTYGRKGLPGSGPIYREQRIEDRKIRILFDHAEGGLVSTDGRMPATFEVAGPDLEFVPAQAAIDGDSVLVGAEDVPDPRAVRFGWSRTPGTNLVNRAGIPVLPFRTDPESCAVSFKLNRAMRLHEVLVPAEVGKVSISEPVTNLFAGAVTLQYRWQTAGTSWTLTPASGEIRLAPGETGRFAAEGTLDRSRPRPLPSLVMRAEPEPGVKGLMEYQMTAWFQRQVEAVAAEAGAVETTGFGDPVLGFPVAHDTAFRVAYDTDALRISVKALDPDVANMVATVTERDGLVWKDDSIEVFVLPGTDAGGRYYHFIANSIGTQLDGVCGPGLGMFGDDKWNGVWETTCARGAAGFTMEFVIPFKTLGVEAPARGSAWALNVCRNRPAHKQGEKLELSCWSQTAGIYHTPSRFGRLVFK